MALDIHGDPSYIHNIRRGNEPTRKDDDMNRYAIAYLNHMLLALAPDGDEAGFKSQLAAARAEFAEEISPTIVNGLILTDEDEEGDEIAFSDYKGQLADENGRLWKYAVSRPK